MSAHPLAGPRQTVDRCVHPTLGPGVAIYENGPSLFVPDAGEPVPFASIRFGGASSGASFLNASHGHGDIVRLDTFGLPRGDTHRRAWSPRFGLGWAVYLTSRRMAIRFESDAGSSFEIDATIWHVGKPGKEPKWPKKDKPKSPELLEWEQWDTWTSKDGEVVVLRRNGPPPEPEAERKLGQLGLLGDGS